ncbi:MAG TPA: PIG-L family deacetylase, partial [Acidimicrobiales bacterium]|nr:PIG-L family deacetylase [Acidimicrobiales bacterium]
MTDDGRLTLMAVHAHPDDEASTTGGILAKYSAEGIRTVLVTCTNGEFGDSAGGSKPDSPDHDAGEVVAMRRKELAESCRILGVTDLELLGYRDSGMMGWPQNDEPDAFWQAPVDAAADRLVELFEKYRPQVVVTYDANGFYGHPDHIQAHRITVAALERSGIPSKLYFPCVPKSALEGFAETLREAGIEQPEVGADDFDFGTPDEQITSYIDCAPYTDTKYDALAAHGSQTDNSFFLQLGRDVFARIFATESFVRAFDRTEAATPETDLFAGL